MDAGGNLNESLAWQEEMTHTVRDHWVMEGELVRLLLEMAATEPGPELPLAALERTSKLLHYLPKQAANWNEQKRLDVKTLLASKMELPRLIPEFRAICFPQNLLGDLNS